MKKGLANAVVVICTHNPIIEKLRLAITAIENNNYGNFRLVIVDNASDNSSEIQMLCHSDIEYLYESRKGIAFARYLALKQAKRDELLIFVDDDNYISNTYIETAMHASRQYPDWGCFGGPSRKMHTLRFAKWKSPLFPYLGVSEKGSKILESESGLAWKELEPIGAGMCLHPDVVSAFLAGIRSEVDTYFNLGRSGQALLSGEDSYIARHTQVVGMKYGYHPNLELTHDILPKRLKISYLVKLLYAYGKSDVLLDKAIGALPLHPYPTSFFDAFNRTVYFLKKGPASGIIGLRQLGQYFESKTLAR
jgi:glycosyltransferase involved in cell wall biosynthesis